MSKATPIKAMRGGLSGGSNKNGMLLRRSLVIFQFVLSQALIISALVITGQIEFFRTKELGFDKDLVVLVIIPDGGIKQKDYLYNRLKNIPNVQEASFSFNAPSNLGYNFSTVVFPDGEKGRDVQVEIKPIDTKYISMYGLQLIAGRNFTEADSVDRIIVNEAFLRQTGIKDAQSALGVRMQTGVNKINAEIIGVVKDYYLSDLRREIYPMMMMHLSPPLTSLGTMTNIKLAKFTSTAQVQNSLQEIKALWEETFPEEVFESRFLDEALYKTYSDEEKMSNIIRFFTIIAVLIGCIGLYGLITFIAAQRTKEIGVRKVLGASTTGIVTLLSKEFMALMVISFVISWPLA
jgi:ABC-type antimicrobial peptide transport system permease subunit